MLNNILHLETGTGADDDGGTGEEEESTSPPAPPEGNGETESGTQGRMVPASELQKANREAAKHRKALRETQARVEELEGASKSEAEKLQETASKEKQRAEDLAANNRELRARVLAPAVGIADTRAAQDAARLIDWSQISDPDDDSEIEKALRELTKDRPYLVGNVAGGSDGGAGGTRQSGGQTMNDLIRGTAGR